MKFIFVALTCLLFAVGQYQALNIDEYVAYVEELMKDEKFVDEYTKWSYELFSQPDYLYGSLNKTFTCPIVKDTIVPTSVHTLRPTDIKCVGAMGDSLTAGLGAHAITPLGLFFENRGLSWSVGGDHTYKKILSIPNALRQYNPKLEGYSTKVSIIFLNGQDAKNNHLNVAKSGDRSYHMPYQANLLMNRLKKEELCDWEDDWKLITFFVGGNDLCSFCENLTLHTPEQYLTYVRDTLDALYNAPIPRTFVNLVLVLDVRNVEKLNSGGFICQTLHKKSCPCAAYPTDEQRKILDDYVGRYQQILIDLVDSGRYDGRDDFTVVYQPFMTKTQLPMRDNHKIDFSYFAPDCFHFSGKGHSQAALSLWNNMLEPVGGKQTSWHMGEQLTCPTEEFPYIFTKKNSPAALAKLRPKQIESTKTDNQTTNSQSSFIVAGEHQNVKSNDKGLSPWQMAAGGILFFIVILVFLVLIVKRQQVRVYIHGASRRYLGGFSNPQGVDDEDDDDVEVWNRSNSKRTHAIDSDIPKTHGMRIEFE